MNRFKLNNRGWGLQMLLACILVLMIGLVIVSALVNKNFGYLFQPIDSSNEESKEPSKDDEQPTKTYEQLETSVKEATKKYQAKYYSNILDGEKITVTINQLIKEKLIDKIVDIKDNKVCTGYGQFILKNNTITYEAFLNCSNYQTLGYNEIYDIK